MMAVTVMVSSDEDKMEMMVEWLDSIISIAASTPEAAAKQKKQKKGLGWEKCSLHCKTN